MDQAVSERRKALTAVFWLWPANCLIAWAIGLGLVSYKVPASTFGNLHFALAFLSHFALIQAAVTGLLAGAAAALPRRWLVLWVFPIFLAGIHFFFHLDKIVYELSRAHFNYAALMLVTTPGVEDNLQFSSAQFLKAAAICLGLAALVHLAARGAWRLAERRPDFPARLKRHALVGAAVLLGAVAIEKAAYAAADLRSLADVLVNTERLPFYPPVTCKRLAARLGLRVEREYRFDRGLGLHYPLAEVRPPAEPKRYNILWIAVEGWRFDALTPEITPNLWRFGTRSLVGERHYSSGNTTRFGIFGMFYGLNGFYWDPFLRARQEPVFLRLLQEMGYQLRAMGSANFNSPEFRQTCFAGLGEEQLFDHFTGLSPDRDQAMVESFRGFLAARDGSRPFFCFMFLDSPHSYRFKELPGFTPPFGSDRAEFVSYERLARSERERQKARLRYRNALAYSDFLIGQALADLEARGLLADTIVMIAGDHGEEFGEAGYCGHNSAFDDWQVRTAFVFHYPGVRPGRIARLTCHQDWAPTVLGLLGVRAPPSDYCQGMDMLGGAGRSYAVASGWSKAGIITAEGRLVFPFKGYRLSTTEVYDAEGRKLADPAGFRQGLRPVLVEVLESARTFKR